MLEFPTDQAYKNVRWSNKLHGKVLGMSEAQQGTASVLSFEPEGLLSNPGRQYATPIPSAQTGQVYVPKWQMKKRIGARFGFGNKLMTFNQNSIKVY